MKSVHLAPLLSAALALPAWSTLSAAEPPPKRSKAEVELVLAKAPPRDASMALRPLHILLVAGPKDHGPGEHDYPAWQKQWAPLLAKAPGVRVTTAFPWPKPEQWDGVDLAVFYLKTRWDAAQLTDIRRHQQHGGGVVTIHWAIGCDQEWEQHAKYFGLSYKSASYRHGVTDLQVTEPSHPILLGLPPTMRFVDEPYWPFIGNRSGIRVLATSDEKINQGDDRARNPGDATVETVPVFWTYEPAETKARVFVSIFGHYMWTFDDPFFRLLLLRGMAWAAHDHPYRLDALATEGLELSTAGEAKTTPASPAKPKP